MAGKSKKLASKLSAASLASKVYISYGLLLAIAISGAVLAWRSSVQSTAHLERTYLANEVYLQYLKLSGDAYRLIKHFTNTALLDKEGSELAGETLFNNIQQHLSGIRRYIGIEIKLVGEEEIDELEMLASIERLVKSLVNDYVDVITLKHQGSDQSVIMAQLRNISSSARLEAFNEMIAEAIEEEASEVKEVREIAVSNAIRTQNSAVLFSLISVVSVVLSLIIIIRDIRDPLHRLHKGATRLAAGDITYRIEPNGPAEVYQLGKAFNHMANEIAVRQQNITATNQRLEHTVAERTAELKQLLEKLQSDTKNRRQLIADVSHELRTPLTVIKGEADIALRGNKKSAEEYHESLERIRSAAMHTARIVDDLLFVARKESGEVRLKREATDLAILLREFINSHHTFGEYKASIIQLTCPFEKAIVNADSVRVQQVLLILMENAVRYGGGVVQLELAKRSPGYLISVTDQGPGMTEAERTQAFERFYRGNNASDFYDGGAGLGLPVAKSIVEAHGGEITIVSEPGQGTTVSFSLANRGVLKVVS